MRITAATRAEGSFIVAGAAERFMNAVRMPPHCSGEPENIVFTLNTTHALNIVIKGVLRPKDHVLLSDLEHNSVLRPLWRMAQEGIIEYDIYPSLTVESRPPASALICSHISSLIRPNTRMLICCHSSNICSRVLLREIGALCRRRGTFVVDAAQSAGHLPIDMKMNIDALCAPATKASLRPAGLRDFGAAKRRTARHADRGWQRPTRLRRVCRIFHQRGMRPEPRGSAIARLSEGIKTITAHGIINIGRMPTCLSHTFMICSRL